MKRALIKAATVVSMDAGIGDLPAGDVLVENGRIAAEEAERPAVDRRPGPEKKELLAQSGQRLVRDIVSQGRSA